MSTIVGFILRSCAVSGLVVLLSSCGVDVQPLMPTPVLYTEAGYKPLDHLPRKERWKERRVYYATNRARQGNLQGIG